LTGGTGENHGKNSHVSRFPVPGKTNETKSKRKERKQIERKEKRQ
jgi:hypothetical protein